MSWNKIEQELLKNYEQEMKADCIMAMDLKPGDKFVRLFEYPGTDTPLIPGSFVREVSSIRELESSIRVDYNINTAACFLDYDAYVLRFKKQEG